MKALDTCETGLARCGRLKDHAQCLCSQCQNQFRNGADSDHFRNKLQRIKEKRLAKSCFLHFLYLLMVSCLFLVSFLIVVFERSMIPAYRCLETFAS